MEKSRSSAYVITASGFVRKWPESSNRNHHPQKGVKDICDHITVIHTEFVASRLARTNLGNTVSDVSRCPLVRVDGPLGVWVALPTLEPIETLTLQERVYRELKRLLMTGHFAPGASLTIRGLAESMGTSVMPVREALQRLSADQAITALPNKSIRVPEMNRSDLLEIQDIRMRLEGLAAEKAAESISDQEIDEVEEHDAVNARALAADDSGGVFESNYNFHFSIYRAAKTAYLLQIIEGLWLKMGPIYNVRTAEWPKYKELVAQAQSKHAVIIEALKRRDPAASGKAMREDVRASVDIFLERAGRTSAEHASE